MGRIAATFATPLPQLLAMPWPDAIRWWPVARAIHREAAPGPARAAGEDDET